MAGTEKIRVLIVDDIPETRENVRKLLAFENDIEVVGVAGTGLEAVKFASEHRPDIILMDINMPDMDGITAVEKITQQSPVAQVIMMSVQSEADYLRRAMLAGARDFLTKPFSGDELVATVRRVYARRPPPQPVAVPAGPAAAGPAAAGAARRGRGHVVAVFSPKGGVGASLLTVNLALALQRPDQKVVIVDGSLQFGNIGVLLNLQSSHNISDLAKAADELEREMIENVLAAHPSGVKVLLAPPRPEMAELVTPEFIKDLLRELRFVFDFVIVDTWRSLHEPVLTIMDEAERLVLLATPDIPTLKNTRDFFGVLDALSYPPAKTVFVLNKMDKRTGITAKDVSDNLKHPVVIEIPLDEAVAISSVNRGIPFVADQRGKPIARAVIQLAEHLQRELAPAQEEAQPAAAVAGEAADDAARRRLGRFMGR